jgi:hypothetical protein
MDIALNRLFLYATIILTGITGVGILYYLQDRKRRSRSVPELGEHDRLAVLDQEIDRLSGRLDALMAERNALRNRIKGAGAPDNAGGSGDQSPRST